MKDKKKCYVYCAFTNYEEDDPYIIIKKEKFKKIINDVYTGGYSCESHNNRIDSVVPIEYPYWDKISSSLITL